MPAPVRSSLCKAAPWHAIRPMRWIKITTVLAVFCVWASPASAEVLLFSTNPSRQDYFTPQDGTTAHSFVVLNNSGFTKLNFTTTASNQRVIITFNAVCSIGSTGAPATYLYVTVLVDPAGSVGEFAAPPTNGGPSSPFHLCGTSSVSDTGVTVGAAVVATARPALAGTNTVRVRVSYFSGNGTNNTRVGIANATLAVTR